MNIVKFEEKAIEFINENGIYVPDIDNENGKSVFTIHVHSQHKEKEVDFYLSGKNNFHFDVKAETFDELFDKAFRILKSYGPKATRERNKETDDQGE